MPAPRRRDAARTREGILDAAERLFAARGFDRVTLAEARGPALADVVREAVDGYLADQQVMRGATFYYDLGSPYAWLAAERAGAVLGHSGVAWTPVLLGGLFAATGRSSWAGTAARAEGMAGVERRARDRGLAPPRWPDPWPNDGLRAMRAAVHAHALGRGRAFALAAFRVHFAEGRALSDEAGLALAARRAGLDPDDLLAATAAQDVKDRLRALTDAALAAGVTGVPSVRVGDLVVWGDDRLEEAAALRAAAR